jgi:hypothetical protein
MKVAFALLLLAVAGPALAQDQEDDAHRADRERTEALNSRSWNGYARGTVRPQDQADYDRAREEYHQRLAAWRARVAACEAGRYDACE